MTTEQLPSNERVEQIRKWARHGETPGRRELFLWAADEIERQQHEFKNFHRLLCERFGYGHDEIDWKRDQVSLIEHIAKRCTAPEPAVMQLERAQLIAENVQLKQRLDALTQPNCQPLMHVFWAQGEPCVCGAVQWGQPSNTPAQPPTVILRDMLRSLEAGYAINPTSHIHERLRQLVGDAVTKFEGHQ